MRRGLLTLLTDFGADGLYVAQLKGVIYGLVPDARIVDISHSVAPQDIAQGAFLLGEVIDAFPPGTVHLAVVDPGVGTNRRAIAAEIGGHWFVAPDNGLLDGVREGREIGRIVELTNPEIRRASLSSTFHGRDLFAPAAAHLLSGRDASLLGPELTDLVRLGTVEATVNEEGQVEGSVLYQDHFGNLITNILANQVVGRDWRGTILGVRIGEMIRTYGESSSGEIVALVGSSGRVEVAVVNGSAASLLGAGPGTAVSFRRESTG